MARTFTDWDLSGPNPLRERMQQHCRVLQETVPTRVPLVVTLPGAELRGELYLPSELFTRRTMPTLTWQILRIYSELLLPKPKFLEMFVHGNGSLDVLVHELLALIQAFERN